MGSVMSIFFLGAVAGMLFFNGVIKEKDCKMAEKAKVEQVETKAVDNDGE